MTQLEMFKESFRIHLKDECEKILSEVRSDAIRKLESSFMKVINDVRIDASISYEKEATIMTLTIPNTRFRS